MKTLLFAASATLAASLALGAIGAVAATPPPQATHALQYLATQQQADGSIGHSLGQTADYTLGARFQGLDPNNLKAGLGNSVYDYFTTWVGASVSCAAVANARDGNTIGKLVQAVVAGGHDPTAFARLNLLADLEGPAGTTGGAYDAATGTFADCASFDSKTGTHNNAVYAQANAILGLESARSALYPVPATAIEHLRSLQSTSGGWPTFGTDNTNATALALMALAPLPNTCAAVDPVLAGALRFLHTQQDPASGGMAYSNLGKFGSPGSDPDSDALVIQALVDVGEDPASASWSNSKGSPSSDILTFQDSSSGGFSGTHASAPDAFTTSQVPAGLDRAPFPDGTADTAAVTCTASPSPTVALPRAGDPTQPIWPLPGIILVSLMAGLTAVVGARAAWAARSRRDA